MVQASSIASIAIGDYTIEVVDTFTSLESQSPPHCPQSGSEHKEH